MQIHFKTSVDFRCNDHRIRLTDIDSTGRILVNFLEIVRFAQSIYLSNNYQTLGTKGTLPSCCAHVMSSLYCNFRVFGGFAERARMSWRATGQRCGSNSLWIAWTQMAIVDSTSLLSSSRARAKLESVLIGFGY